MMENSRIQTNLLCIFRQSLTPHPYLLICLRVLAPREASSTFMKKQVCIPVGCVPPACWPHPSMHYAGGCLPGGYAPGGCVADTPPVNAGFPLDLENLGKWEYTWKTWKYHGILKNLINIMEKWHETWKNLVATKNSLNYWNRKEGSIIWSIVEMINFLFKCNSISLHIYIFKTTWKSYFKNNKKTYLEIY